MHSAALLPVPAVGRPIRRLRWWIGGLLFACTVINYIHRQTLPALAPFLKDDCKWSTEDYAKILIAFRIAYTIGQATLVASINDTDAPLFHPALTSVKEFPEELGRQLAEFALNRLRSPSRPPQHVTIPTRLQIRHSVATVAKQKPAV